MGSSPTAIIGLTRHEDRLTQLVEYYPRLKIGITGFGAVSVENEVRLASSLLFHFRPRSEVEKQGYFCRAGQSLLASNRNVGFGESRQILVKTNLKT